MIEQLSATQVLRSRDLRIRRAWPRSPEHLLLDIVDADGAAIAGQWFADAERTRRVRAATPGAWTLDSVVLQPRGGDRRLPLVGDLVRRDQHHLVAHRPERRAVIAAPQAFVKAVRPGRLESMVRRARLAATLDVGAPEVLDVDQAAAAMTTAVLSGQVLTDLLGGPRATAAARAAGQVLARLHAAPIPKAIDLGEHGPAEERAVLDRWSGLAQSYGLIRAGTKPLGPTPSGHRSLIHRDLHDGQLMIDRDGDVGVLDFDLLTVGDPALDLANLLAHLELRAMQGLLGDLAGATAATLEGYRPDAQTREALPGYLAMTRERLRAVYAFRDRELLS